VTVVEVSGLPPEALGRPLVVLEPGFVQMRYDKDSFAKIASRKRQLAFGVTLGLREATFRISYVKMVLEAGDAAAVVLKEGKTIKGMWYVTAYTDILPPRIALYLEPGVPDELGGKAKRLDELTRTVSEMKKQGLKVPEDMKRELDELNEIIWSRTRIFRRFISRPGSLKITVPTPDGMAVISWKVEKANQSLGNMIRRLHAYLGSTMGVIMSFDNAVSLRDAIVQARAQGKGEGQLRARLLVRREGEGFTAHPYAKKVSHSEREEDVREYQDFLDELTGGSFFAEAIEKKDSRSVVFQGLITVRAAFHLDAESRGHE
jgi:murein DD-endopeptidase MepM/ murein hydrolase activator NlpD